MIRGLTEKSRENIRFMEQLIEEAEEVIQYIDDWEPSDEEDDLDEEELWEPVIRHMSRYPVLTLGVSFGVKDKEKEGWLEKIKSMSGKGILKIVLPPDCQVSEKDCLFYRHRLLFQKIHCTFSGDFQLDGSFNSI